MPFLIELITGRVATVQLGLISSLGTIIMVISAYIERSLHSFALSGQYMFKDNIWITDIIVIIVAIVFHLSLLKWASNTKTINQRESYIKSLKEYKNMSESLQ